MAGRPRTTSRIASVPVLVTSRARAATGTTSTRANAVLAVPSTRADCRAVRRASRCHCAKVIGDRSIARQNAITGVPLRRNAAR